LNNVLKQGTLLLKLFDCANPVNESHALTVASRIQGEFWNFKSDRSIVLGTAIHIITQTAGISNPIVQ